MFSFVHWVFHEGGLIFDNTVVFRAVLGALQTQRGGAITSSQTVRAVYRGKMT